MQEILLFLNSYLEYWRYVPTEPLELRKLPKQWLVNVAWTTVGQPFGQ